MIPGIGGDSEPDAVPTGNSTTQILVEFFRMVPASLSALGELIGAIVIGMVILAFAFRTSRKAMALFIVAIFGAMTQRVREWRDRKRPQDINPVEEEAPEELDGRLED